MRDSLICRGADTRLGARKVLESGGGANHRSGGAHSSSTRNTAKYCGCSGVSGETVRKEQNWKHDDF
jgi:hypothetical protein